MTDHELRIQLQNAHDTKANWEAINPVLREGEIVVVFDATDDPDQVMLKIGDGTTHYGDLDYFGSYFISRSEIGVPNGVASLDENGKIVSSQLPSPTVIEETPEQLGVLIYNGETQMPVWMYYDPDIFIIGGITASINAGEYVASFQPAEGYCWEDGTRTPVYCNWAIQKKPIDKPTGADPLPYNGAVQHPEWQGYDPAAMMLSGIYEAMAAGEYTAQFTPDSNHEWSDGTSDPFECTWSITQTEITISPVQVNELIYNGAIQTPEWENYDPNQMYMSGTTIAAEANTYTVTFTALPGYSFSDELGSEA